MKKSLVITFIGILWLFFAVFAYVQSNVAEATLESLRNELEQCKSN